MAVNFEKDIYRVTKKFPQDEKYRKVDQLRRSSASICDNIAESYGKFSYGAKIHSLYTARGEGEEARRQIERVEGIFINTNVANILVNNATELIKGINGYIRFLKSLKLSTN